MNERQLFESALEIADPRGRRTFLDGACHGDADLRAKLEALLKSHATAGSFLDIPAADQMGPDADNITTNTIVGPPAGDQDAEHTPAEAEFRQYLQPATRPGWMGRLGHYEIEAILGRGAFGIVAKAFDEKLHRVVAIKLMNPELAATSPPRKRFLREARTAAAATHENIVAIHAVEAEPIPYLVMEYIPGQTLQQRMDQQGPLEMSEILRIGQQVAAGLAAAHAMNLIHRDIKPSNILLTGGPNERTKISDFGLARAVDDATLTSSGLIAGTPMYMAPEQARGETLDHRADLFSLGSVLYQMASGRPPFRAANTVAVLKRVCEDTPRPLDDVIPGIPGWLETIIFRLLEKDRDNRYQTAQDVADLLARCQSELQHQGQVTCVPGRTAAAAETQDLPAKKGDRPAPGRWPIGWLTGGAAALVLLGVIAVLITKRPDPQTKLKAPETSKVEITTKGQDSTKTGWHGWPADAPKPAIAPFDADQAKQHQVAWAKYLNVPVEYTNSVGMTFHLIPPGEFMMGSTPEEIDEVLKGIAPNDKHAQHSRVCFTSETPQHKATLAHPVYLGIIEVTQAQYERVMGTNPSSFAPMGKEKVVVNGMDTTRHPVETVSWKDAAEFSSKLSEREKLKPFYFRAGDNITPLDGTGYRLPTEAEWEFACRAGTTTKSEIGDKDEDLLRVGWFSANSGSRTHAVGELKANPYGLHDMHGNVWEWVQDSWEPTSYADFMKNPAINPTNSSPAATLRVLRGHAWDGGTGRSSGRYSQHPNDNGHSVGFRVSLTVDAVRQALNVTEPAIPKPVANLPSMPDSAFVADRRAAEYVLSIGGSIAVRFNEQGRLCKVPADLPQEPFQLTRVDLTNNQQFNDRGLENFKDCKHLTDLHLHSTPVTDVGLANLQSCKELSLLQLGNSQVSDAGLVYFQDCKNLMNLGLSGTKVTDKGLAVLANCKQLMNVDLNGTQVTDTGVAYFKDCKDLTLLYLSKSKVSAAGIADLKKALPKCKIAWDDGVSEQNVVRGWHGWPADAPSPAIAPFNAEQAKQHQDAWAAYLKVTVEHTNSIGMKFRLIPPGEFLMGCTAVEIEAALKDLDPNDTFRQECIKSEAPQHKVILTQPIYLGVNEVTQAEYEKVMGANPSHFAMTGMGKEIVAGIETTDHPVEMVSWNDAAEFCAKLSQKEKLKPFYFRAGESITPLDGAGYRLPSEAEWEFSCRAGTTTTKWIGNQNEDLMRTCWFSANSGARTHAVGELKANPFGLCDIDGNVWEWVQDSWDTNWYGKFPEKLAINPSNPFNATPQRVIRGSHWNYTASHCRSSNRLAYHPTLSSHYLGFRVSLAAVGLRAGRP